MATAATRRFKPPTSFTIREDTPTEDDNASMAMDEDAETEERTDVEPEEGESDNESSFSESGASEDDAVSDQVTQDMIKLQEGIPGFKDKFRLIKRIGEGTFSTVYKAEDLAYDSYKNDWDFEEREKVKWTPPPLKRRGRELDHMHSRRRSKFVAIKKIYVTSSPARIYNELELLHDLRDSPSVCPIITAFRHTDQVLAVLPYFRHSDFRDYYRNMTVTDMAIYLGALFTGLRSVHEHGIIHRDIKPTNFLYDPSTQRGVLVDFGLAEREGSDSRPCLCHETATVRRRRVDTSVASRSGPQQGYPNQDTRPSRRANRAGTRGFRAPEVLFKCTEQTTKLDIWSAGVILLTIMSRRFPFFNSADDVEALIEISTIFGTKRMKATGLLHGCVFETTIPTIGRDGFNLEKIVLWSTCRTPDDKNGEKGQPLSAEEKLAVEFLDRCLELDPSKRISAEEALEHDFLRMPTCGMPFEEEEEEVEDDDDMDII